MAPPRGVPEKVVPFVFTGASKSDLGWAWLAAIDTGRYKEYAADDQADTPLFGSRSFDRALSQAHSNPPYGGQVSVAASRRRRLRTPRRPRPPHALRDRVVRWCVTDADLHDDLLISAALVAHLDTLDWARYRKSTVIEPPSQAW